MINYNLDQNQNLAANLELSTQEFIAQTWVKLTHIQDDQFDFYVSWLTSYKLWDIVNSDLQNHLNPANYNYFNIKNIKFLQTEAGLIPVQPYLDYGLVVFAVEKSGTVQKSVNSDSSNNNTNSLKNTYKNNNSNSNYSTDNSNLNSTEIKPNSNTLTSKLNLTVTEQIFQQLLDNLKTAIKQSVYPLPHNTSLQTNLTLLKTAKVVGYMCFTNNFDFFDLDNIAVNKTYRGLGIGKFLLEGLIYLATSIQPECQSISLEVRVSNQAAINLYQQYGFNIAHIRKNYYEQSPKGKNIVEDAYLMVKTLTPH